MNKKGKIIVQPMDGLANRMRVIAFCYQLAKETHAEMLCLWTIDGGLSASFESLFCNYDFEIKNIYGKSHQTWKHKRWWRNLHSYIWLLLNHVDVWIPKNCVTELVGNGSDKEISVFKARLRKSLEQGKTIYLASGDYMGISDMSIFSPVSTIMKVVTECLFNFDKNHSYGLHIRRADNAWAIEHSPIELFERQINEIIQNDMNAKFYLSTDDYKTAQYLVSKYKEYIVYRPKELTRNTENGIREAVADMWILSQMDTIYGSYWSSFSEVASWINNKPYCCLTNIS